MRTNTEINIPRPEYETEANKMLQEMKADLSSAVGLLAEARQEQNAVKANGINEKLTTMKGLLKFSENTNSNLQEALSRKDFETSDHEFGKIYANHKKMKQLLLEAKNVVGQEENYSGGTDMQVDADPSLSGGDSYYGNPNYFQNPATGVANAAIAGTTAGGVSVPPTASPFQ